MTLGEIKIEALKLMFAEVGDLSYWDIEELENSLDYGCRIKCSPRRTDLLRRFCWERSSLAMIWLQWFWETISFQVTD